MQKTYLIVNKQVNFSAFQYVGACKSAYTKGYAQNWALTCELKFDECVRLYECKNRVVHAADESKVVVQGLDGYIVAENNGQQLICSLKEEQRIKEMGNNTRNEILYEQEWYTNR